MYVYIQQIDNFYLVVIITKCLEKKKTKYNFKLYALPLFFSKVCQRKKLALAANIYF